MCLEAAFRRTNRYTAPCLGARKPCIHCEPPAVDTRPAVKPHFGHTSGGPAFPEVGGNHWLYGGEVRQSPRGIERGPGETVFRPFRPWAFPYRRDQSLYACIYPVHYRTRLLRTAPFPPPALRRLRIREYANKRTVAASRHAAGCFVRRARYIAGDVVLHGRT